MADGEIRHILVPVDFSELSASGLRYAVRLARCTDARVTALYADPFLPPPYFTERGIEGVEAGLRESRRQAQLSLAAFAAEHGGAEVQAAVVEEGLPADSILRHAAKSQTDLIVMGTHGRSGVSRIMLGSVTERVLREATVPVLAVRGDGHPEQIRRILCPVNDTPEARRALALATRLARCLRAGVTVLHAREDTGAGAIEDLCAWVPEQDRAHCAVSQLESSGDVARDVIGAATGSQADLLVIGARHRRFFDATVLGANTVRMLRHAPCPVLAVFGPEERT